jgi:hypothetical protein
MPGGGTQHGNAAPELLNELIREKKAKAPAKNPYAPNPVS